MEREEKDYRFTVGCTGVQYVIIRWSGSLGALWLRTRYGVWAALGGFLYTYTRIRDQYDMTNQVP